MIIEITVPDDFPAKFLQFDAMDTILRQKYCADIGVSRAQICLVFGALTAPNSCWHDPAFLVWAGLHGLAQAEDFYTRGDPPSAGVKAAKTRRPVRRPVGVPKTA